MLFQKIGIDFKLFLAQILNFIVLLIILKVFLYKPFLKVLEERQLKLKELQEKEEKLRKKTLEVKHQAQEIIKKAKERSTKILLETKKITEQEREEILKRAEREMEEILKEAEFEAKLKLQEMLQKEKEEIEKRAKELVRKVLGSIINKEIHTKFLKEAMEELRKIDFSQFPKDVTNITLVSAFPLKEKDRKEIEKFFYAKFHNPYFQEKVDPSLIAGIKIFIDNYLLDASLAGRLEKEV